MIRRSRPTLGTFVEITVLDDRGADAARAIDHAFAAIDRVMRRMSFHDPASDLTALNRDAATRAVTVDPWTFDVLEAAADLFVRTDGRFDCTVAALLVERGLLPGSSAADAGGRFPDVELDRRAGSVRFRRPLCIDLGGLAKGFAVDRAIDALRAGGLASAVVNAGGDLRVLGSQRVPIHLRVGDAAPVRVGALADGAFASSSNRPPTARRRAPGALVDAATRRIVGGSAVHSVIAPTCLVADALTKVVATAGVDDVALLRSFGATALVH